MSALSLPASVLPFVRVHALKCGSWIKCGSWTPLLVLLLLPVLFLVPSHTAHAATYTVTTTRPSGPGSVDAAVLAAKNGDTIVFAVTGVIVLDAGLLLDGVTLQGPGASQLALDLGAVTQNITIVGDDRVVVSGLTIQHSKNSESVGGAISNYGRLTLRDCILTQNLAGPSKDALNLGGGIFNDGALTVTGCTFTQNTASAGGAILNSSVAVLTGCTFAQNSADKGGAVSNSLRNKSARLTLTNCIFTQNTASEGGAVFNPGTAALTGCTFTQNSADKGGALFSSITTPAAALTVTDDIFYGDTAAASPEVIVAQGTVSASHCDFQGGLPTGVTDLGGNLADDPLFVNAPADLHVQPGSPVTRAGIAVKSLLTDFDGTLRPDPPTMGAYEGTLLATVTQITSSLNPSVVGQSVTFTVTVTVSNAADTVPTGTVTLRGLPGAIPPLPLTGGKATYTTSTLPLGFFEPTASYVPDANGFLPSSTGGFDQLIQVVFAIPTANAQTVAVPFNTATAITLTGSDPNNVSNVPQAYTVTASPTHGTLSGTAPNLTYTPDTGYSGADSFPFTVSDSFAASTPAIVSLRIAQAAPVSITAAAIAWGTAGTAALTTSADGLRLLPSGRSADLPWLGINRLTLSLSRSATLTASDVSITGVNIASYGPVTVTGSRTRYTLTLAQPIRAADRVTLTVGSTYIATFTRHLDVLPGDVSDDGTVTLTDAVLVRNVYLNIGGAVPTVFGDINGDGVVDLNDYNAVRTRIGTHLP